MIYYNNSLILIGGYGERPSELQSGSQFIENSKYEGKGWTNEIHMYNISQGKWRIINHITISDNVYNLLILQNTSEYKLVQ